VPGLLHHDQEEHVLIISNLGFRPNLSECFGNLCGITFAKEAPENLITPPKLGKFTPISPAEGLMIGQKVGSFFAGLHRPRNVAMLRSAPYKDPPVQHPQPQTASSKPRLALPET